MNTPLPSSRLLTLLAAAALLAGCATTSPDAAIAPVREQLRQATGATVERWPDAQAPSDATAASASTRCWPRR